MKVNGQEIPAKAIEYELNRIIRFHAEHGASEESIREQLPMLKKRAEAQTIGTFLLFEEADKLDITVPEEEVDASIKSMADEVGGEDKLKSILSRQGSNIVQFRNEIRRGKRVDKLVEKITADLPDVTDDEARKYFEEHQEEFLKEAQVQAQHILVTPASPNPDDDLAAIAKIRQIRARIEAGSDFATEAAAHSDCPSGKQAGGSLGWFSRGMMVKEFDEAVFSMPVGGLSDIIKTQFGYHIIYKNDEQKESTPDFFEVSGQVKELLRHDRRGRALSAHVDELRQKAQIEP